MRKILIIALFIGIPAFFLAVYLYTKPVKELTKVSPDFVLKASELYEEFSLDENTATEKYVSKVLQVTGILAGIQENNNGSTSLFLLDELMGINCSLDSAYSVRKKDLIQTLKTGRNITIKGKCNGMLTDVQLSSCVFASPEKVKGGSNRSYE